ncbi:MAG: nodulation protein NfeD [Acidobacteria bacterium]|nr:nodulation protein NfeD [Acidobacteriota bacterium]
MTAATVGWKTAWRYSTPCLHSTRIVAPVASAGSLVHNEGVRQSSFPNPARGERKRLAMLGLLAAAALAPLLPGFVVTAQSGDEPLVVRARLADAIHPITAEYVVEALAEAEQLRADLFVLEIDTPGGLDGSMRQIIQAFLASDVPVCLFVGPAGARAASAGFFMAMAADVVAMAPGTNMGAASPVPVGGGQVDETMSRKLIEDADAYMRSLAEQHGRPLDLASAAVTDGRSYSASESQEAGLADLRVDDFDGLLDALDGRTLRRDGRTWTLEIAAAEVVDREMSTRQTLLSVIANPQVAYMLMLIGIAGLYFELSSPGAIVPGVLGGVSLVLAMLAFQILPINLAGLALMGLAIVFFILELKVTSYGLLTIAGLVAFVLGSLMLVPGPIPEMRLQLAFVLPTALAILGIAGFLVRLVLRAHRAKVQTGPAGLLGKIGQVTKPLGSAATGEVFVHGELWRAVGDAELAAGESIEIVGLEDGMTVRVRQSNPNQG